MSRCFRKFEGLGEKAVMEKAAQVAAAGRKRKVSLEASELCTSSVQLKTRRLSAETPENPASSAANSGNFTCETVGPDHALASCSSSNRSSELEGGSSKFVDLEDNKAAVGCFASSPGDSLDCNERTFPSQRSRITTSYVFRRGTTRLSEAQAESGDLQSTARPFESNPHQLSTAEKMPSEAELEEFFAAAEKNIQKKIMDEYNYDIVKDQPLEGRYEWVQIQLNP